MDALKSHRLQDCTFPEVAEYLKSNQTIILPYALSEQHGAHLPLDVDIRNADFISAKLADRLDCLIAPTLNYTFSGGMMPGTINVKPNTFSNLMGEIIESLHVQGFRNFIIIPGHGGSESLLHLKESLRILKWLNPALQDALILLAQIWDFSPTWTRLFDERDYHAAWAETSLMLHWCPEVVRKDRIQLDAPEVAERLREDPDSYQLRESFTDLKQEIIQTSQRPDVRIGVMGFPERATAELGARIEQEFLDNAAPAIQNAIAAADQARQTGSRIVHGNGDRMKIRAV
ncbi:MAG: creatininase family protein [Victivallales bacterium]|nr:creatininase family protein [Victivallales bacterium]